MASWVPSKPTSRCPATSWGATSLSIYPSWSTWGLFKGTAYFTGPRPPVRGVDMFRTTWCASVLTELSSSLAAWAYDSIGPPMRSVPFDSTDVLKCVPIFTSKPACGTSTRHQRGPIFVCHNPRVVAYESNRSPKTGLEVERICFSIESPEF